MGEAFFLSNFFIDISNKTSSFIMQLKYIPVEQSEPVHADVHVQTPGAVQVPPFWHVGKQTPRKIIEEFFHF